VCVCVCVCVLLMACSQHMYWTEQNKSTQLHDAFIGRQCSRKRVQQLKKRKKIIMFLDLKNRYKRTYSFRAT